MNDIVTTQQITPATMEHVLGTGDLSKLTIPQRVSYYLKTCETLGLNPLTQPFRFLTFQGQVKMYATKDCGDQLRNIRKIDLAVVDKTIDGDLFMVTVRATTADGRRDEDVGAVPLGLLKGEARANAVMKGITKAKRRVTLSVCGMGYLDEGEVATLPGARTFAADESLPVTPIHTAAARPVQDITPLSWIDKAEADLMDEPNASKWVKMLGLIAMHAATMEDVVALFALPAVKLALAKAPTAIRGMITDIRTAAVDRLSPQMEQEPETPPEADEPLFPADDVLLDPEPVVEPPDNPDDAFIARVRDEVAALTTVDAITLWSKGEIKPGMIDLKARSPENFQRAIDIIDARRHALKVTA